jgi:hypothetical protein
LEQRAVIVPGDFTDLYSDRLPGVSLEEPSVVFYGLTSDDELIDSMRRKSKPGCKLIYYFNELFPEIKAERVNFPFFISIVPFKKPVSELDWLAAILRKRRSSLGKKGKPTLDELWDELTHDYDIYSDTSDIAYYKRRLRKVLGK